MTVLRRKGEDSLKVIVFALALAGACMTSVAGQPTPLLVGAVRDSDGRPIAGASIRATAADGRQVGAGISDGAGTFALGVSAAAATVEVRCPYCVTTRAAVRATASDEPLVVFVRRFHALSDRGPSQRDFAVLPYRRPSETLALFPYLIPARAYPLYGDSLSDRGLNLGYALVLDQGAATYDLSGQTTAFSTVPDRAIQQVDFSPASDAYRYGSYAGGGTFDLEPRGDQSATFGVQTGQDSSVAGYARIDGFTPALAESFDQDDGALRRRAGLDYDTNFAGGVLSVGAVGGSQSALYDSTVTAVGDDSVHLAYATASRRYRTFAQMVASQTSLQDAPETGDSAARSSAVAANFRVEHPATVLTAFGFSAQNYTGAYSAPILSWPLDGHVSDYVGYVEATASGSRASFDAAASLAQIAVQTETQTATGTKRSDFPLTAVLPSLSGNYDLGGGFSVRASASDSFRAATLTQLAVELPGYVNAFERGSVVDAGVQFDDKQRVRLEAMAFSEALKGFVDRDTTGIGAALTWQVTPLLSLRAWTLHDAADQSSIPLVYVPGASLSLSRGVLWASYDNPSAVRFDAILHRDLASGPATVSLDGDVVVPLARGLAATVGTVQVTGKRSFYAGLRTP